MIIFYCQVNRTASCLLLALILFFSLARGVNDACGEEMSETVIQTSAHRIRALHVVAKNVSTADMKRLIDQARLHQFNLLILGLFNGVRLKSMPPFVKEGVITWSTDELRAITRYARENGIDVIPEIKFLTHQEHFLLQTKQRLMFNTTTYDPRKPEVYDIAFAVLDEVIELMHPKAIHIGHDELAGHGLKSRKKWLRPDEQVLPADLFLQDVERIHAYLKKRGVEVWMWGDMLISPDEFPGMFVNHLHGTASGYGKALRNKLPKDIVICDWHYFDEQTEFPSLAAFKAEGFRVLGATWKEPKTIRNFSRYAKRHGADGMIATTWIHVQRKEWDVVKRIICNSGEAFLSAE